MYIGYEYCIIYTSYKQLGFLTIEKSVSFSRSTLRASVKLTFKPAAIVLKKLALRPPIVLNEDVPEQEKDARTAPEEVDKMSQLSNAVI